MKEDALSTKAPAEQPGPSLDTTQPTRHIPRGGLIADRKQNVAQVGVWSTTDAGQVSATAGVHQDGG